MRGVPALVVLFLAIALLAATTSAQASVRAPGPDQALVKRAVHLRAVCVHRAWCLGWKHIPHVRERISAPTTDAERLSLQAHVDWLRAYAKRALLRIKHPHITSAHSWLPLAKWVGWPARAWRTLMKVMRRESGGNPRAWNRSTNCEGLMQIMKRFAPRGLNLFDPETNLRLALRMWLQSWWRPWALTA